MSREVRKTDNPLFNDLTHGQKHHLVMLWFNKETHVSDSLVFLVDEFPDKQECSAINKMSDFTFQSNLMASARHSMERVCDWSLIPGQTDTAIDWNKGYVYSGEEECDWSKASVVKWSRDGNKTGNLDRH